MNMHQMFARIYATSSIAVTYGVLVACASGTAPVALHENTALSCAPSREVTLHAGSFVRGHNSDRSDEGPVHTVQLSLFAIDATLVTVAQYTEFAAQTSYVTTAERQGFGVGASEGMGDWAWERIPGASFRKPYWERTADHAAFERADAPVTMVSYFDASAYCTHMGKRLPTEAEWEYAMRAGSESTRYPWGDDPKDASGRYRLNFWQGESHLHNTREDGFVYVSPVTAFAPNAWRIHDPVGNVWQWTADWYSATTYADLARDPLSGGRVPDPKGPAQGTERVLRGGSWWCGACTCEGNGLYYRGKSKPDAPFNNIGFRCARSLQ